ncbi:MAG TPA: DNA polymerase/3'-5' exonuclease PolX [Syntrophomonadaceae bacterium]|nr:DNA polymerase/3'-5' exonuclease PolX [Syntrophomonadaceae bacterium]
MTNREVARTLDRIADILLIKDENIFKVRAYRKAAESVYHLDENLIVLYEQNKIGDIPGVGKAVKTHIEEMLEKDSCEYYENLLKEVPFGVLEMLAIPGLGHKTVRVIYEELGIDNVEDLASAVEDKKIRKLPGLGSKSEYNIKKGIEFLHKSYGKANLGVALPIAEDFLRVLQNSKGVQKASIVGSARRGKALVSDIDILVATNDYENVKDTIINYKAVKKIKSVGKDLIGGEFGYNIEFEVILVDLADYIHSLVWTTGSKDFCEELFNGVNRSEYTNIPDEFRFFEKLDLQYIPPELRENRGEIELARTYKLPDLIKEEDLKGDLHIHSDWSDGSNKISEIADACKELGYSYMAITDHSKSLPISGGLNEERLFEEGKVIDTLNQHMEDFTILKGIEVDIMKDGSLDFSDEILEELDIVVASIHSNFKLDKDKQTDRLLNAMKNEHVDIIGHLTGRLLNRRPGYELHLDKILESAAENNIIFEINSHPDRLDIDENMARRASQYGIKIAINSDAHRIEDLKNRRYGVINARRGWLTPADVVNTWDFETLTKYLKE